MYAIYLSKEFSVLQNFSKVLFYLHDSVISNPVLCGVILNYKIYAKDRYFVMLFIAAGAVYVRGCIS
jgi:hypothetical protein